MFLPQNERKSFTSIQNSRRTYSSQDLYSAGWPTGIKKILPLKIFVNVLCSRT
jgi:hypothetical protein